MAARIRHRHFASGSDVPSVSRSASTLAGGLLSGLDRATALRFSFYLAIPTLGAVTIFDLISSLKHLPKGSLLVLGIGLVAAFVSGLKAIRFFWATSRSIALARFWFIALWRASIVSDLLLQTFG